MINFLKYSKELGIVVLLGMAIVFFGTHWDKIAAIQAAGVLLQIKETKEDVSKKATGVFAAVTTVRRLEIQTQQNKKETEVLYLKTNLITLIENRSLTNADTIGTAAEEIEMVLHYHPGETKKRLTKKLENKRLLTSEISRAIDVLEIKMQ